MFWDGRWILAHVGYPVVILWRSLVLSRTFFDRNRRFSPLRPRRPIASFQAAILIDNRRFAGFSSGDFMSRSRDLIFDGGDMVAFERERRFGLQFNYFFGN